MPLLPPLPLNYPLNLVVHHKQKPFDIFVARPSKWGNPFEIGVHGDRAEVIVRFETYLLEDALLMRDLPELAGKVLGCWCADRREPKPCHAGVLLKYLSVTRLPYAPGGENGQAYTHQIQGEEAQAYGWPEDKCPYSLNSFAYSWWKAGWRDSAEQGRIYGGRYGPS